MQWRTAIWPFLVLDNLPIWISYGQLPFIVPEPFSRHFQPPPELLDRPPQVAAVPTAQRDHPSKREARLQREKLQAKQPIPGRRGAKVYEWDYDDITGVWTREGISNTNHQRVENVWEQTKPAMRAYNSIKHEYDVYYGFMPIVLPEDPYKEFFDDEDEDFDLSDVLERQQEERAQLAGQQEGESPNAPAEDDEPLDNYTNDDYSDDDFKLGDVHYLYAVTDRYGIQLPNNIHETPKIVDFTSYEQRAYQILCFPIDVPSDHYRVAVTQVTSFVNAVAGSEPPSNDVAGFTSDLSATPWCATPLRIENWDPDLLRLGCRMDAHNDEQPYILHHVNVPASEEPWRLVVFSNTDAIHATRYAMRNDLKAPQDLAFSLLYWGMSFRTIAPLNGPMPQPVPRQPVGLGYKKPKYHYTVDDYREYERRRDAILRTSQAREVRMLGGVLARLASDHVTINDVLRGPTMSRSMHIFTTIKGTDYVDDALGWHEIDILCGVSRTWLHYSEASNTKNVSWWPLPSQWKRSGQDVEYWSSENEIWYQRRLARILAGEEQPKTNREWKRALKLQSLTPTVENNITKLLTL
ncbi:hypothetical protein PsYK624_028630 [Phanerochaete sordida]|uniref:Uncharacterized protein n=1 Tax=Phanerochaete sordida TaxID=48140 RepID=A0A9P3G1Z2_9APHY|nr:hypothetical protein PsYK624_028630 [Phanerochaete sordida]